MKTVPGRLNNLGNRTHSPQSGSGRTVPARLKNLRNRLSLNSFHSKFILEEVAKDNLSDDKNIKN